MISCICRGDVLDGLGWYRIVIRKHWEWIRRFDRYTGYKWVTILKFPFYSLYYPLFFLRSKTICQWIFNKSRSCYLIPHFSLSLLTRQENDWGLVWGLWVTILKNLSGTITFPLHSLSYSIINLLLGHYIEYYITGLLGMAGRLDYILCLSISSGHYTDVFILFLSLYWPIVSLFRPIRVTILENFRAVWGLILNSSDFPGNSLKIPLR